MATPFSISVVLSTRNRGQMLARVLEAHRRLLSPGVGYRHVVVDNGSTDHTPALLAEAARTLPHLAVLREPQPGKSRALNLALGGVLDSDLVVFTDDDALPEPDWLQRLWAAAAARPDTSLLGGTIRLSWPASPPAWLSEWGIPLDVCYAATTRHTDGPIAPQQLWGPNFAVRGHVLREGHRFNEDIGPNGTGKYPMGCEVEFNTRLGELGHRAWFVSDAVVHHLVRSEQMTLPWVLQRAFSCGLGAYRTGPKRSAAGIMLRSLVYSTAARAARLALVPGRAWFWLQWQEALMRGLSAGRASALDLAETPGRPTHAAQTAQAAPRSFARADGVAARGRD